MHMELELEGGYWQYFRGGIMNPVVAFRNYGSLYLAEIVPKSELPYVPKPQYRGNVPDGEIRKVAEPIFLCHQACNDVWKSLNVRNLDYDAYVTPATVHGEWKARKRQGVIYAKRVKNITYYANPYKPIPSSAEIEALFMSILDRIKEGKSFEEIITWVTS